MPLAQRRGDVDQHGPDAVDLGKAAVQLRLHAGDRRPVGIRRSLTQDDQQVEVGHTGRGGAARNAAVHVRAVETC
ncbi:hypothetical protein [Streptomyces gobitricini]|uniref:hypothetical protein n=1 Tax=Streptomyces gobitricini TaxID=68211 RepID=UPI0031D8906B